MADFGGEEGLVDARIVYWGVEGAGKTTNLRVIHSKLRPDHRGELRQVPTRLDPSVGFSVLPIELGQVGGVRTRIQIVAVPGAPEHAPTRKQLLDKVDGVVFVVDTSRERIDDNLASFDELRGALAAYGRALEDVPLVIQYNKRDRDDPFALEELHRKLSMRGVAAFEATAAEGTAVLQTLTTISKRVIRHLREQAEAEAAAPAPDARTGTPVAPAPPPEAVEATTPPAPAVVPTPSSGLDPALLTRSGDAEEAEEAAVVEGAEALFEAGFRAAREAVEVETEAAAPPPHGDPAGRFAIVSAGFPSVVGPDAVRLPLVVRDEDGRSRRLVVTVRVEPEDDAG